MRYLYNKPILPQEIYAEHLAKFNIVKVSKREIDIISCILNGRSAKGIAHFLSISPKTVEAHTYNVMKKLECSSREGLISLIENSDQFLILKEYYLILLVFNAFEKCLKDIAKLGNGSKHTCVITYWDIIESPFFHHLREHLTLAGMSVLLEVREKKQTFSQLLQEARHDIYMIYALPYAWVEELQAESDLREPFQESCKYQRNILFLLAETEQLREIPQEINKFDYLDLAQQENYYFSVFALLKRITPYIELDGIISGFKEKYDQIYGSVHHPVLQMLPSLDNDHSSHTNYRKILEAVFFRSRKKLLIGSTVSLAVLWVLLLELWPTNGEKANQMDVQSSSISIRSDFLIPAETTILKRPKLMSAIAEKLRGNHGIQIVALVGIGGAGKTTLARQFASHQINSIVWEINAETKNSLVASFETLAYAISRTQEEKEELTNIQEIKDSAEREGKLLYFLKERIKLYPNWFFIYDNVESLSDIKNFFPYDMNTWGNGKVIVTTQDTNIANNSYIDTKNVIHVGELNDKEKLTLFDKIFNLSNKKTFTHSENEAQKINFLKDIPPFPLDVSVAAYYLNNNKITYSEYLGRLSMQSEIFSNVQETFLKDIGEYNRTRYSIITLSLKKLIDINQDYKDLLFLVSLLDSQDIPKDLLVSFKNDTTVDSFMHDLKKNSFIFDKTPNNKEMPSTFSVHRSTQQIFYFYIINFLNLNKNNNFFVSIDKILEIYLSDIINNGNFSKMRLMVNHISTFLNHKELLNDSTAGSIGNELGRIYFYLGDYINSKNILEESLVKLNNSYGNKSIKVGKALVHLGDVNRSLSNYKDSQGNLENGLEIFKEHYNEDHEEIAWTLVMLGNVYREQGDLVRAQEAIENGLKIYRKNENKYQKKIGWVLIHLGDVYRSLGNYEKAKYLYEKSVIIHKKNYGEEHLKTAWSLVYLGIINENLGNYEKAKMFILESIKIYEENLGRNHIGTAWALVRLGIICKCLNDYNTALDILNKCYEIHKKYYGDNHVRTAWVLVYLGDVYKELGKNEKAKEILIKSLRIHQDYYGKKHIKFFWILTYLANVYKNLGDYKEGENLLEQSLLSYEKHYGKNHIETAGDTVLGCNSFFSFFENFFPQQNFYTGAIAKLFLWGFAPHPRIFPSKK